MQYLSSSLKRKSFFFPFRRQGIPPDIPEHPGTPPLEGGHLCGGNTGSVVAVSTFSMLDCQSPSPAVMRWDQVVGTPFWRLHRRGHLQMSPPLGEKLMWEAGSPLALVQIRAQQPHGNRLGDPPGFTEAANINGQC